MSAMNLGFTLRWLGHASFHLITPGGKHVLIDPWLDGNPKSPADVSFERVDLILVTHGHGDHVGDTVRLAAQFDCPVFCGYELYCLLKGKGVTKASGMGKGGTQRALGLAVTATHAIHSSSLDEAGRAYAGEPMGFVVTLENGERIYFAGDTGPMADMAVIAELYSPTVAVLPMGDLYTMGPREAAWAAQKLGVRYVVPMHYGTFDALTGTPDALRAELKARGCSAEVIAPEPGGTIR